MVAAVVFLDTAAQTAMQELVVLAVVVLAHLTMVLAALETHHQLHQAKEITAALEAMAQKTVVVAAGLGRLVVRLEELGVMEAMVQPLQFQALQLLTLVAEVAAVKQLKVLAARAAVVTAAF